MVVDPTGVKVRVKFAEFRSNRSRDIRLGHFVRTTTTTAATQVDGPYDNRAKRRQPAFCLKTVENAAFDGCAAVYLENREPESSILQANPSRPALHLH